MKKLTKFLSDYFLATDIKKFYDTQREVYGKSIRNDLYELEHYDKNKRRDILLTNYVPNIFDIATIAAITWTNYKYGSSNAAIFMDILGSVDIAINEIIRFGGRLNFRNHKKKIEDIIVGR